MQQSCAVKETSELHEALKFLSHFCIAHWEHDADVQTLSFNKQFCPFMPVNFDYWNCLHFKYTSFWFLQ